MTSSSHTAVTKEKLYGRTIYLVSFLIVRYSWSYWRKGEVRGAPEIYSGRSCEDFFEIIGFFGGKRRINNAGFHSNRSNRSRNSWKIYNSHGKNYKRLTFLETTMTVGAQKLISKNVKFLWFLAYRALKSPHSHDWGFLFDIEYTVGKFGSVWSNTW